MMDDAEILWRRGVRLFLAGGFGVGGGTTTRDITVTTANQNAGQHPRGPNFNQNSATRISSLSRPHNNWGKCSYRFAFVRFTLNTP